MQNLHDKLFKQTMSHGPVAREFLQDSLPQEIIALIDTTTLEPQKDSFISSELQETFADLLFRVEIQGREGYIYFLFEHKSYPAKDIALQLLGYMVSIWKAKRKQGQEDGLPVIIPLVVYHGQERWTAKVTLGEMIQGFGLLPDAVRQHIPDYKYLLYDLSTYTDRQLLGAALYKITLRVVRGLRATDIPEFEQLLLEALLYARRLLGKERAKEYADTLLRYIFHARADLTKDDYNQLTAVIETDYPEGSEVMMTLAEVFRKEGVKEGVKQGIEQGVKQGVKQGIEQGVKEKEIAVVKNALREGVSVDLIVKLTGLTPAEIEKIAQEVDS